MLCSRVVQAETPRRIVNYPKLMKYKGKLDLWVLFRRTGEGMVLRSKDHAFPVGYFSKTFSVDEFENVYGESLNIANEVEYD